MTSDLHTVPLVTATEVRVLEGPNLYFPKPAVKVTLDNALKMLMVKSANDMAVVLAEGESIRTEISSKYDRESVAALFEAAGLRIEAWPTDPATPFGLVVGAPA